MSKLKDHKKKLSQAESEAFDLVKKFVKKPKTLKPFDFQPGQIIMYSYNAKDKKSPYDATPMAMILGRNKKHTLALNWHWIPPSVRKNLMKIILRRNKQNIKNNKPLDFSYQGLLKLLVKTGAPALRKYINKRISIKGVVIPHEYYLKVVELRGEHFMGISSSDAWKMSVTKINKRRGKK